jgi:tetratricopeptide (TPR) repeat protein
MPLSCQRRSTQFLRIVPARVLGQLRENMALGRIDRGIQLLRENSEFIDSCTPKQKNACVFIGHLAQWVDTGFAGPELISELLKRFPSELRSDLSVRDFVHLELAEGFVAMYEQDNDAAIRHFQIVLAVENETHNQDLIGVANYWTALCYKRLARYHDAVSYVIAALEFAAKFKHLRTAAVTKVLEAWILFQEGGPKEALKTLCEAEELLAETDDHVARGHLNILYSVILRHKGAYDEALQRSDLAIKEYKKRDEHHRRLAQTLVNDAIAKRLLALEFSEQFDHEIARNRNVLLKNQPRNGYDIKRDRESVKLLRDKAFQDLDEASAIASQYQDYPAEGDVHVTYGYLHLDEGDFDRATSRALAAYSLGNDKNDLVLKAQARILQSAVESSKVDEQIIEQSGSRKSRRLSCEYAREAVEHAKKTQDRELMAQATVILGRALVNDGDLGEARACCDQAAELLKTGIRDQAWRDLLVLKSKFNKAGDIETIFREWSQGAVGDKTFKQINDDFAAIIIPRIWRHEGQKVSHVAARLSMSPKKVRKILRNQGILSGPD